MSGSAAANALRDQASALSARGRTLEAMEALSGALSISPDPAALLADIAALSGRAAASFNAHLEAGEIEAAEPYAAALARLAPGNPALLTAALDCNRTLGRWNEAAVYARALVGVDPGSIAAHSALAEICKVTGEADAEIAHRMVLAMSPDNPLHPLVRLRDLHDAASLILCRPLTDDSAARVETLLAAARALRVETEPGSELEGWERHYRLLLAAVDLAAVAGPTPGPTEAAISFLGAADGEALDWAGVRAAADRLGARAVFFAAADEAYVDLYARWYVRSVLKYCDLPCLVVVHVIGGARDLAAIAGRVDVADPRVVFAGDDFDAGAIATACHDAPPKGRIEKPVAHLQSARFQRLGALLRGLERPVFVSDIDLILQRGVADLLAAHAGEDLVFNENEVNWNAGSRLTANLLLAAPSPNALRFADFLAAYLDRALAGAEVTRWIDQLGLLLARQHVLNRGEAPRLGYFDTTTDINNLMYPAYQAHPFRFLSLFHGFDTSSLEGEAAVLG